MRCKQCQKEFTVYPEDNAFYEKVGYPAPTKCPSCRNQLRFAYRNEYYYYPTKCDLCNKAIISVYDPAVIKKVYCHKCWWTGAWDARDFGRDYDLTRSFFEQYFELWASVSRLAMMNDNNSKSENCEYTQDFAYGKNCYLVIASWYVENVYYSYLITMSKEVFDCFSLFDGELLYECVICENCYGCRYLQQCLGCRDVFFGFDLRGCSDCLFCSGLRNQQYCIWNKKYSEEEYKKLKAKFDFGSYQKIEEYKKKFKESLIGVIRRYADFIKCEDSIGDYLSKSKNVFWCFHKDDSENCRYMYYGGRSKDCFDCSSTGENELCYGGVTPDTSYKTSFAVYCWHCKFVDYSENCHASEELFGCVGLQKKKFCILNKQYDETTYKELKAKIVEQMEKNGEYGEFFPAKFSPFAYNESPAIFLYPLNREAATKLGFNWKEDLSHLVGRETIKAESLPDTIKEVKGDFTKEVLACASCGKNYKILPQELDFYQKNNIPLPRNCFYCRHLARRAMVNHDYLYHRQCSCNNSAHGHNDRCANEFETTYSPDRPERVYCESCYQKEIY